MKTRASSEPDQPIKRLWFSVVFSYLPIFSDNVNYIKKLKDLLCKTSWLDPSREEHNNLLNLQGNLSVLFYLGSLKETFVKNNVQKG